MTYPAPAYLEDDDWFGPATLSEKQISLKEAMEQAISDNQILPSGSDYHPATVESVSYTHLTLPTTSRV